MERSRLGVHASPMHSAALPISLTWGFLWWMSALAPEQKGVVGTLAWRVAAGSTLACLHHGPWRLAWAIHPGFSPAT